MSKAEQGGRTLRVIQGKSRKDTNWKVLKISWEKLVERLSNSRKTSETHAEYMRLKKDDREKADKIKDIGGFMGGILSEGGRRKAENVKSRSMITLDADNAPADLAERLGGLPECAACIYSTHSHSPEAPRLRLIIPLDREVTPDEHSAISRKVADIIGLEYFDRASFSANQMMYWPSHSKDVEPYFWSRDGGFLCADSVLEKYKNWRDPAEWPQLPGENPRAASGQKKEDPRTKEGPVGDFCRAYTIAEAIQGYLPDVYEPTTDPNTWKYIPSESAAGLRIYDDVFATSYHATDPAFGGSHNAFDLVRIHKFGKMDRPGEEYGRRTSDRLMSALIAKDSKVQAEKRSWADRWRGNSAAEDFEETYMPEDFTDVGQARALADTFGEVLRYSAATKWLVYNGKRWEESEEKARKVIHKFTDLQMKEARKMLKKARKEQDVAAEAGNEDAMKAAKAEEKDAKAYRSHILNYRKTQRINATLTELAPSVVIDVKELDRDGYLLNTPEGTVDLKTGEMRPHDSADYCTKITACGPSKQGAEEWSRFLEQVTGGDKGLENYLQICFGMAAVGVVKEEKLLIPFGSGGNGKSTTCFAVHHVLGDYAGSIKPEALIIRKTGKNYEFADLRGKRLVLAAELQEGQRLDTSAIKRISSIDNIRAEKKYKDPFEFAPSHTAMLFTNHLPKIGSNDRGTLDRLVVLPFKGRFRDTEGEIKNYAGVLADRCGGAILSWVIEGAKKFIEGSFRLPECEAVKEATAEYTQSADWLGPFLEDMCETDLHYSQRAGKLYERYRAYCSEIGESYIRSAADFRAEMEKKGFLWRKSTSGAMYHGVRLRLDFDEAEETETVRPG